MTHLVSLSMNVAKETFCENLWSKERKNSHRVAQSCFSPRHTYTFLHPSPSLRPRHASHARIGLRGPYFAQKMASEDSRQLPRSFGGVLNDELAQQLLLVLENAAYGCLSMLTELSARESRPGPRVKLFMAGLDSIPRWDSSVVLSEVQKLEAAHRHILLYYDRVYTLLRDYAQSVLQLPSIAPAFPQFFTSFMCRFCKHPDVRRHLFSYVDQSALLRVQVAQDAFRWALHDLLDQYGEALQAPRRHRASSRLPAIEEDNASTSTTASTLREEEESVAKSMDFVAKPAHSKSGQSPKEVVHNRTSPKHKPRAESPGSKKRVKSASPQSNTSPLSKKGGLPLTEEVLAAHEALENDEETRSIVMAN